MVNEKLAVAFNIQRFLFNKLFIDFVLAARNFNISIIVIIILCGNFALYRFARQPAVNNLAVIAYANRKYIVFMYILSGNRRTVFCLYIKTGVF